MEKMTIHRALSELKVLDARITKAISEFLPTGIYVKGKPINSLTPLDEFQKNALSKNDQIRDLIDRKVKIKSHIVAANASNFVIVAGKKMTIAEAINYKAVILQKKEVIKRMYLVLNDSIARMNKANEAMEKNIQTLLEVTLGKENIKAESSDVEAIRKPYTESNEVHLFDPLEAKKLIEATEKEVSEFEADVDASLSEINAITFIEI